MKCNGTSGSLIYSNIRYDGTSVRRYYIVRRCHIQVRGISESLFRGNLKVDMQCNKAACEANMRLGMIKRNFRFKSRSVMLPLYKSKVRPHLDYCMQAWRPHYRKDIDKLEKVQRRATKMVEGLKGYSYIATG